MNEIPADALRQLGEFVVAIVFSLWFARRLWGLGKYGSFMEVMETLKNRRKRI